ncbi:endo-1,4-beta-xylanase [Luteimicrobium xylanilyticum]|uniref:Beta-xylanase n=1 Tax=Luteimicrobium xylanilyticum TaxID=1133546 RepID=A0A5P9Q7W4_9MICO|nr:endo-1,4-beta-xylanase [Luteimicrobium xylanilyticum]QFU97527.1 Endo-1,4-beta-xylanase [Luteimicrobium xylanilyticum]
MTSVEAEGASDARFAHRVGTTRVRVLDPEGRPRPGELVTVAQEAHAFGFGCTGADLMHLAGVGGELDAAGPADESAAATVVAQWLGLFDTATLPFYWARFEPVEGEPDTDRMLRAARWFVERGVTVKGHPLVWHTLAPRWLLGRPDAEVEDAIRRRITRDVTRFAGLVDLWDAINEVVILPAFTQEDNAVTRLAQRRGRVGMVELAFDTARDANPDARLVLNDFDLSADYERLVEDCLEAGVRIDALGLQTHMHQGFRGADAIQDILDRFARFGLPLQLTETSLVSGALMPPEIVDLNDYQVDDWPSTPEGEARQAEEVVAHYETAFAHPAVESLTYWGMTDATAWLGAPSGLVRRDGTPKPAYDALRGLVRGQWWVPPTTVRTDDDGAVVVRGFAGRYAVSAGVAPEETGTRTPAHATLEVTPGESREDVVVG